MITADGTRESVHEFAQAVREALHDLPHEEIDELTDGLEADLFERAAELGGTDAFGDPGSYADELRASAGLPPRPTQARRYTTAERVGVTAAARWKAIASAVRGTALGSWLIELAVTLRPVWWVLRGWVVWQMVALVFWHRGYGFIPAGDRYGEDFLQWVLLLALMLFSVQWGRGRWMPGRWSRVVLVLVSIVSVIALLPVVSSAVTMTWSQRDYESAASASDGTVAPPGLYSAGQQVFNIYAYDADGNPLQHVRLYDQDGRPLQTVPDVNNYPTIDGFTKPDGTNFSITRSPLADGPLGWSVYPLPSAPKGAAEIPPFTQVQPLSPDTSEVAPSSRPTPTPASTPGPSVGTPTPAPTATPGS